jgi:hypothetical protein
VSAEAPPYKTSMKTPNYSGTATYFERRAAKALNDRRRTHLAAIARLYRDKAREAGVGIEDERTGEPFATLRRERVAAMFRALGDPDSIAKSRRAAD